MQEETNSFLKAIEEANKKMQVAEISLEEKDQRIGELDRLIERMEKVTQLGARVPLAQPPLRCSSSPAGLPQRMRSPHHLIPLTPAICDLKKPKRKL